MCVMTVSPRSIHLLDPLPNVPQAPRIQLILNRAPFLPRSPAQHCCPTIPTYPAFCRCPPSHLDHSRYPPRAHCIERALRRSEAPHEHLTGLLLGLGQQLPPFSPDYHTTSEQSLKAHSSYVLSLTDHSQLPRAHTDINWWPTDMFSLAHIVFGVFI